MSMDVARTHRRVQIPGLSLIVSGGLIILAGSAGYYAFSHPAVHETVIDRESIVTDVARRGTIVRGVAASGTLVAGRIDIVAAQNDGTIETLSARSGTEVHPGMRVATMRSPMLETAVVGATAQLAAARAERSSIEAQNTSTILQNESEMRAARADRDTDVTQNSASRELYHAGLIPAVTYHVATIKASEDSDRYRIDQSRTHAARADARARLVEQDAKIADLQSQLDARRVEVTSLAVLAQSRGTIQTVSVQPGQRVSAGTEIARIASTDYLVARLQVAESDARNVRVGQSVTLDVSGSRVKGFVTRIAPSATNGTVATDVSLSAASTGLRIDSHVDGTIEFDHLSNVVSILRPIGAGDDTTVKLFRVTGEHAQRFTVRLGAGSSDRVVVRDGLAPGDTVIVSDMTSAGDAASIRLR